MKPVVVVADPLFGRVGGGGMVTAWMVQALADDYDVVLVCHAPVDFSEADRLFGTTLANQAPRLVVWPIWMRLSLKLWPGAGYRLKHFFQEKTLMRFAGRESVRAWISTFNESRLPMPGAHYVHFPAGRVSRFYVWFLRWWESCGLAGPEMQMTWVNSHFTATAWRRVHDQPVNVLYPPVPALGEGLPWAERAEFRVVCLGRLLAGKGLVRVARIIGVLRARGVPMTLAFVGAWACSRSERRDIERELGGCNWVEWHVGLSRDQIASLVARSRYGLHGMEGEPFGIAVAELQASGCVVFAPLIGGPAEILNEPTLLYQNETDAVDKILSVVRSPELQAKLHAKALGRRNVFSPDRFVQAVRADIGKLISKKYPG